MTHDLSESHCTLCHRGLQNADEVYRREGRFFCSKEHADWWGWGWRLHDLGYRHVNTAGRQIVMRQMLAERAYDRAWTVKQRHWSRLPFPLPCPWCGNTVHGSSRIRVVPHFGAIFCGPACYDAAREAVVEMIKRRSTDDLR